MTPSASRGNADGTHGGSSGGSRRDLYLMEKIHPEEAVSSASSSVGAAAAARVGGGRERGGAAGKSSSPSSPPLPPKGGNGVRAEGRRDHPPKARGDGLVSPPPPHGGVEVPAHGKVGGLGGPASKWCVERRSVRATIFVAVVSGDGEVSRR